jgi:hypothetical protein
LKTGKSFVEINAEEINKNVAVEKMELENKLHELFLFRKLE